MNKGKKFMNQHDSKKNSKKKKKPEGIFYDNKFIYITLGISFFLFLINHFQFLFSYIITLIIPIFLSMKDYFSNDEDCFKTWVSYFIAFIIFFILDIFHKFFIEFLPFYFFLRITILIFLYHPLYKGSLKFYDDIFIEIFRLAGFFKIKFSLENSMLYELEEKLNLNKNKKVQ